MKKITQISIAISAMFIMASCGNSKKDDKAVINDLKVKLEKKKKEKSDDEAEIKKLEADLLRLDTNAANAARIKLVSVMPVVIKDFEHFIDLMGKVDAENISYITPRGMPGQVRAIYVKQGQQVKKGQLLLKLDDAIAKQQVAAARQQLEGIKTQLDYAKNLYQRQKNLWDQGIGTEVQLITARTNVESLQNQLTLGGEQVKVAIEQMNTANVYSDVSGVADIVSVRLGEVFGSMGSGQIKIVNTSSLKIVTNVPENYLTRLHTGTPVLINIPDAQKENIPTSISVISQSVDATSRGFLAEAKIPYNAALKPNQTAIMRIKDYSAANAIVIPVNMVQSDETGKYVFVMVKGSDGKTMAHKVPVAVGEIYGDNVEIKGGLKGGEQLITEGYQSLYEGQVINVTK